MAIDSELHGRNGEHDMGNGTTNGITAVNGTNGVHDAVTTNGSTYTIKDQWHSKPGYLRVITVGAGAAGLLVAYKMQKDFRNYDLVCYEKYKRPFCLYSFKNLYGVHQEPKYRGNVV